MSSFKVGGERILENNLLLNKNILEAYILTQIIFFLFVPLSFKHQITQVFRTNMVYSWWEKACKSWELNINRSRDFIKMATVWLALKQEYNDAISNMDLRWVEETVSSEGIDEVVSRLSKMVWAFQRSLYGQLSNPEDKEAFQVKIYKNIDLILPRQLL